MDLDEERIAYLRRLAQGHDVQNMLTDTMLDLRKAKLVTIEKTSGSYMHIIEITDAGRNVVADQAGRPDIDL